MWKPADSEITLPNLVPNVQVQVSHGSNRKAEQLKRFQDLSAARCLTRDAILIRSNLLVPQSSRNYTVLLAMGRK